MCGIAGIFNAGGVLNPTDMENMLNAIRHRGPDDSGMVFFRDLALGHVRLSIIDLSKAGHQPMGSPDGQVWIVFNGEIFNYRQIRSQLEKLGYKFRSKTDTEVLLYSYMEYGEAFLEKLRGFFAFCIYDKKKNMFFMARDRL